jgi:hypothetical protein
MKKQKPIVVSRKAWRLANTGILIALFFLTVSIVQMFVQ